jgi:hypothetical protein
MGEWMRRASRVGVSRAVLFTAAFLLSCKTPVKRSGPDRTVRQSSGSGRATRIEPPYDDAELRRIRGRWQGAWVIRSGPIGKLEAWSVEGDQVTISDGSRSERYRLEVVAPCKAGLVSETALGATTNYFSFAFDGEQLYAGASRAGIRQGDSIVACSLSGLVTWTEKRCSHWEKSLDEEWSRTSLSCSVREEEAKRHFVVERSSGPESYRIDGALLIHPLFDRGRYLARRAASFKEAARSISAP